MLLWLILADVAYLTNLQLTSGKKWVFVSKYIWANCYKKIGYGLTETGINANKLRIFNYFSDQMMFN